MLLTTHALIVLVAHLLVRHPRPDTHGTTPAKRADSSLVAATSPGVRPEAFGAVGDRIADDTAPLRAALAAACSSGQPLLISRQKHYRLTDQLTAPGALTMVIEPEAELYLDTTTPGKRLLYTRWSLTLTNKGLLTGSWRMDGQQTNTVNSGQIKGQHLIRVDAPDTGMIRVRITGGQYRRSGDQAIVVSQQNSRQNRFTSLIIENTTIRDCYHGVHLNNLDCPAPIVGAVFRNNVIRNMASKGPGLMHSQTEGSGNGLTTWGRFDRLMLLNNTVDSCGRMGIELFIPHDHFLRGWHNRKLQIVGNRISNCGYFALSQQGDSNYIARNTLTNWHTDYIEMLGNGTTVERNVLDGVGFSTTSNDRGTQSALDRHDLTVRQNTFRQRSFQKTVIEATFCENVLIENNTIRCTERQAGTTGFRAPISVGNTLNAMVRNNVVTAAYPFQGPFYNFGRNAGLTWTNDRLSLTGYAPDSLASLFSIYQLRNSTIQGVRVVAPTRLRLRDNAFNVLNYPVNGLYSYVWTGSQFVTKPLTAKSLQQKPPTSPAQGDTYWLTDNPTGEWSGQGRKLATWTGNQWVFTTVQDVFPYETNATKEPFYSHSGLPTSADKPGTTYLLMDGPGLMGVRFINNDFSGGGRIADRDGKPAFRFVNTRLWKVGIVNTTEAFDGTNLQLNDISR
ncbi:hypothetical protein FAES_3059 [Fibrella aestuarina BUZ 2]|uniref:Uncharacterized protein n=1 Tax=Fibrella aestuarina BUZ 2 TaxID=1166018 RepID=I0KAB5_9BACT|nr:DUF2793 domain-containing protein [Fibrella aestuarina]CCH01068.1 hypothetical protein FAES_3059 [Fibrella aestuarina BUZ 2]